MSSCYVCHTSDVFEKERGYAAFSGEHTTPGVFDSIKARRSCCAHLFLEEHNT